MSSTDRTSTASASASRDIYGTTTLAEIEAMCRRRQPATRSSSTRRTPKHQLVDWVHEAIDEAAGIVINPAGLTFRSIPLLDALKMFPGPIIELHISNIHRREPIYHHSLVSTGRDGGHGGARTGRLPDRCLRAGPSPRTAARGQGLAPDSAHRL